MFGALVSLRVRMSEIRSMFYYARAVGLMHVMETNELPPFNLLFVEMTKAVHVFTSEADNVVLFHLRDKTVSTLFQLPDCFLLSCLTLVHDLRLFS